MNTPGIYISLIKPLTDAILSFIVLLALSPLLLLISTCLLISGGGPVLFIQKRIGKNERPFLIYKFRTMPVKLDSFGKLLPDEERQSTFGNMLRFLHLDELPQFWNVIKGDISIIGPRPLLPEYLPYYSDNQKKRHNVKPGITGLSQIYGGNSLPWNQRLRLDSFYAENISFGLDMLVFAKSLVYIFKGKQGKQIFSKSFIDSKKGLN